MCVCVCHAAFHNALTGVEFMRVAMGAGTRTRDMPARITDYVPHEEDVGGFFDNAARAKKSWEGKKQPGGGVPKSVSAPQLAQTVVPDTRPLPAAPPRVDKTVPEETTVKA